ncbi:zinc-binding alcohol dehydrogenase family protein [Siphonobacter sp. SORGH_AS_0500]|uniref:quinone oxidoreductase family protein n=1 Tax=Siphonobacter sp. SORGH_AS_0500 TaxID=1864824 RepID=UPI00286568DB|nr:zinc-binding alcohol dehydrogenase family protein [Siphonobacter sp. SORGH_AS_0500]MDR6197966.1 NADPH:quinone reductase-like Zn-dependent oxidoreductase [Siphonobacter sp. SORGH_AS_0500]
MKAAVIFQQGEMPQYADFPEPGVKNDDELVISVKAAAIKNFDKGRVKGTHYSAEVGRQNAIVIGGDGVGLLADGTRVYALGEGMMAEKAIVDKRKIVKVPDGMDDASACALPNAVAGSAMALRFRAAIKPGETVLINGATGFTGKIAIQVAKHYGAKKVIVTGRNQASLQSLVALGADETVLTTQTDEAFIAQLKAIHNNTPIDIILDYLWGHTAELLLASLKGNGSFTYKTRFISIGSVTGDKIQLSAENLRSVDLQLSGSGLGSWTRDEMKLLFTEILPEMFQLAADNQLKVETIEVKLSDIEKLWEMEVSDGKRLVVTI